MAPNELLRSYLKFVSNLNILRLPKPATFFTSCTYSTSESSSKENDTPVKFTTTNASKISIYDNLEIGGKRDRLWFQPYVVAGSLTVFLLYFCVLREENDIDEFLKGSGESNNDYATLIDLQLKLNYCKQHKISPGNLEAKIEELKTKLNLNK